MFLSRRLLSALERTHKKVQKHLTFIQGQTTCLPPPFLFSFRTPTSYKLTRISTPQIRKNDGAHGIFFFFYNFKVLEEYSYIIIAYCDVHMYTLFVLNNITRYAIDRKTTDLDIYGNSSKQNRKNINKINKYIES